MKKGYGKMRRLFESAAVKCYQIDGDVIYFSEGHYVVKMPVDLYDREIAGKSDVLYDSVSIGKNYPSATIKQFIDEYAPDKTVLSERVAGTFSLKDFRKVIQKVIVLKSNDYNPYTHEPSGEMVVLNPKFFNAAEQMTRGGVIRCGLRRIDPVFFLSNADESWLSDVMVMVLPIRWYKDLSSPNAA